MTLIKDGICFAKANVDDDFNLYNLNYNHDDFIYPFESQEIPKFIELFQ